MAETNNIINQPYFNNINLNKEKCLLTSSLKDRMLKKKSNSELTHPLFFPSSPEENGHVEA